ncbi:MAG: hypothetical protein AAB267_04795 [Candidatus Desantisbacteria bacterium]
MRIADCESEKVKIDYWVNGWQTNFSESATKIKWQISEVAPASSGTLNFVVEVD